MDFSIIVDVLKLASVYGVLALGFVIVYRTSRVLNLAQPGVVLLAGLMALTFIPRDATPTQFWLTALVLLALGALAGLALYALLLRPMAGQSHISQVLMTLAALFLLQAISEAGWRGESGFIPMPGRQVRWEVFGTNVRLLDVAPVVVAALVVVGLAVFYRYSRSGRQMRAVAENPASQPGGGSTSRRSGRWPGPSRPRWAWSRCS